MQPIRVHTQINGPAYIQGRNGHYQIVALSALELPPRPKKGEPSVFLDGIGKRNSAINGGFEVPRSALIDFCKEVIRQVESQRTEG